MAVKRCGFTLIEVLIVTALIAVLAAIIFPYVVGMGEPAQISALAESARHVRDQLEYHRQRRDTELSMHGYPKKVRPEWFPGGRLPRDPWTHHPLQIQVVAGPKSLKLPLNKFFVITPQGRPAGPTAWYNSATGKFYVKVPKRGGPDKIDELFDAVNGTGEDDTPGLGG